MEPSVFLRKKRVRAAVRFAGLESCVWLDCQMVVSQCFGLVRQSMFIAFHQINSTGALHVTFFLFNFVYSARIGCEKKKLVGQ